MKCRNLVLIAHRPGREEGIEALEEIGRFISSETGLHVKLFTLDSAEELIGCNPKDVCVLALLLTSGGHYTYVKELSERAGARFLGKLPNNIVAEAILGSLKNISCERILLVYRPAKRNWSDQLRDLEEISRILSAKLKGTIIKTISFEDPYNKGIDLSSSSCVVVMGIMPNRMQLIIAKHLKNARMIGYLGPWLAKPLAFWLKSFLK